MADEPQTPPLPPGLLRVVTLGPTAQSAWQAELRNAPGGRGIVWVDHEHPEQNISEFIKTTVSADVAVVTFKPGSDGIMQLQRWAWLVSQLGVPHFVITVERSDLPPDGRKGFDRITDGLLRFLKQRCSFQSITAVPISSSHAGNIGRRDSSVGWYMGPTLLDHLNTILRSTDTMDRKAHTVAPQDTDQFQARMLWIDSAPLTPWRHFKIETDQGLHDATVTRIKHKIDALSSENLSVKQLQPGDVGVCNLSTESSIEITPFQDDRDAGILTCRALETEAVLGYALVDFALRRASNIRWQETTVTPSERARQKKQQATVLWFTGLSGAGKSTIADLVEKRLKAAGKHTMLLDGDNVRHGLNKDLGFTDFDRVENIRRISEVSKLMCDAGLIVLVSFISPFKAERQLARETLGDHGFSEIYVATPLEVAEKRDVKGLYAKARRGEIKNFTGIDSPYEVPENPEITVDTANEAAEEAAERIVKELFDDVPSG